MPGHPGAPRGEGSHGSQRAGWGGEAGCHVHPRPLPKERVRSRRTSRGGCAPGGPRGAMAAAAPASPVVGAGAQRRHDIEPTGAVLVIHADFHSQKALLFNKIFVAGKFCVFVC